MSRLLFAAARGARIQELSGIPGCYEDTTLVFLDDDNSETLYQRIHPDDEHLQYGPISSALRRMAKKDRSVWYDEAYHAACSMANSIEIEWYRLYEDDGHRTLFLLFLAEALADEGM